MHVLLFCCFVVLSGASAAHAELSVRKFGAIPDDDLDDTRAIQAAINRALDGPDRTVVFPAGKYWMGMVYLGPGITLKGPGAILQKPPKLGRFARSFTTQRTEKQPDITGRVHRLYTSDTDSKPLVIEGLTLDGNVANQDRDGFSLEHQAGIFLQAAAGRRGKLKVILRDLKGREIAGSFIHVFDNCGVTIDRCESHNVFRGLFAVTGKGCVVRATRLHDSGEEFARGVDIEPNGPFPVDVEIRDAKLGNFDAYLPRGSRCEISDVKTDGGFSLHSYGDLTARNCSFTTYQSQIRNPGQATFVECKFILNRPGGRAWNGQWRSRGDRLHFDRCEFIPGKGDHRQSTAIYQAADKQENGNQLLVTDSKIGEFGYGIVHDRGGNWTIKNNEINAAEAYRLRWTPGFFFDVEFDGNRLGPDCVRYWHTDSDHPKNAVRHTNTTLTEQQNRFSTKRGMHRFGANQYRGRRVIRAASAPTQATPGLPGDVWVDTPTRQQWRCVLGSYGGEPDASWELVEASSKGER